MATKSNVAFKKLLPLALVLALAAICCFLLYRYDNKYTADVPKAMGGVLMLDETIGSTFLIYGWEYYAKLLTPEDFLNDPPLPDEIVYIGQYGGFEAADPSAPPHGSASYRLTIALPEEPRAYMLELPEIYSSYNLYVNGKKIAQMGEPRWEAYRAETGNRAVTFEAADRAELLFAVTDFSGMYSGMVYPPAFGAPDAVLRLLNARLFFRSALCAAAVTIGLIALLVGLLSRKRAMALLYGLLCLAFVGYAGYPLVHTFLPGHPAQYALENAAYCAMLTLVMLLQIRICGDSGKLGRGFIAFGGFACLCSAAVFLALPAAGYALLAAHSYLIDVFRWATAAYITFAAVRAALKSAAYSRVLLSGTLIFDCALVMDRLLPLHEPIVTGWFPELAGFALVLCVGAAAAGELAAQAIDNVVLRERAAGIETLMRAQRAYYPLLEERIGATKKAEHDLRHHMLAISGLLERGQYAKLAEYVSQYQASLGTERIRYSDNEVANVLAYHYARLAKESGIKITLRLGIPQAANVADADLCAILSNLLENALEACRRQQGEGKFIALSVHSTPSAMMIKMENSSDKGIAKHSGGFLSSKAEGRTGYGLDSIAAIAKRYGGKAEFEYNEEKRVFASHVTLNTALQA